MSTSVNYIQAVDLPTPPPPTRRDDSMTPLAASFTSGKQALVVNSQLAAFDGEVPLSLRSTISYGLLLGQLAADKASPGGIEPLTWFEKYNEVMGRIGWSVTRVEMTEQEISDKNAELHKAIIPVLTTALGPGVAAGAIILAALKGLEDMNKDSPWLTLFQRKSQTVKGAKFGLTAVDAGADGGAQIKTVFFGIKATSTITQVLFVKVATSGATVKNALSETMLSAKVLEDTKDALTAKITPFVTENIRNIDI